MSSTSLDGDLSAWLDHRIAVKLIVSKQIINEIIVRIDAITEKL